VKKVGIITTSLFLLCFALLRDLLYFALVSPKAKKASLLAEVKGREEILR